MRLYYLDNPEEQGSNTILRQLGLLHAEDANEKAVRVGMNGIVGLSSAHRDEMTSRLLIEMEKEHQLSDKCIVYVSIMRGCTYFI